MDRQSPTEKSNELANLELYVRYRNVEALKPYGGNARTHSDKQISQIAASIGKFGFNNPVLVDADNRIVAGHGRVEAAKGIQELLQATALVRSNGLDLELDLVGSNLKADFYRREADQTGLTAVRFHGVISDRDRLRDLFNAADIFVLPTHSEGFPRVLLEAMAFGIPILTTFVGGIPSLMEDGVNCLQVPVRDAEGLAKIIERALLDSELRNRIANGGNQTVRHILSANRPSHARRVAEESMKQDRSKRSG